MNQNQEPKIPSVGTIMRVKPGSLVCVLAEPNSIVFGGLLTTSDVPIASTHPIDNDLSSYMYRKWRVTGNTTVRNQGTSETITLFLECGSRATGTLTRISARMADCHPDQNELLKEERTRLEVRAAKCEERLGRMSLEYESARQDRLAALRELNEFNVAHPELS